MENTFIPGISGRIDPALSLGPYEFNSQLHPAELRSFPLNNRFNSLVKRSIDIIVSLLVILILLSWLIPLLAVIVKLNSPGPVFFIQRRNSKYGKIFSCIKIRSMYENPDADTLAARENDSRITAPGAFLRKYHLDELPQFFNVLIGDMSLVGPRPYMIYENEYYSKLINGFELRHAVKPGISGLAQSYGQFGTIKNLDMMRSRLAMDHHYISNWSVFLDIKILCRTLTTSIKSN